MCLPGPIAVPRPPPSYRRASYHARRGADSRATRPPATSAVRLSTHALMSQSPQDGGQPRIGNPRGQQHEASPLADPAHRADGKAAETHQSDRETRQRWGPRCTAPR